jgi:pimeloyl-ACP methyl ester carboxylesterase
VGRAAVAGVELDYELRGHGAPVVLIHAGMCANFFQPLFHQDALSTRHLVLNYHRVGFGGSTRPSGPVSLADQAAHCRALMEHLGTGPGHVVGHSSGASIALQLALDAPDAVASLALLDPARPAVPNMLQAEMVATIAEPAFGLYREGDNAGAVDVWMRGVCGPDYEEPLERALPGALDQAVADAGTFFGQELPAVVQWSFGPDEAARITQPALAIAGPEEPCLLPPASRSSPPWLPNAESFGLPGATHLLQVESPEPLARALAAFFSRVEL